MRRCRAKVSANHAALPHLHSHMQLHLLLLSPVSPLLSPFQVDSLLELLFCQGPRGITLVQQHTNGSILHDEEDRRGSKRKEQNQ